MIPDSQIESIVNSEMTTASGWWSGELSNERETAMDYYLGEPYGDEVDGRSKVVTRETLEAVENIMPELLRIFGDVDNIVSFEPVNADDEPQAEQETDVVSYIFWKQNRGFFNTYTFIKDGLLSKTGILKYWLDDAVPEEKEEYDNLTDDDLGKLLADTSYEREITGVEINEDGTYHLECKASPTGKRIQIEPIAPEDFGVRRDARSPYVEDLEYCFHRRRNMSRSDLVAMGLTDDQIDTIPTNEYLETAEELSRRNLSDEQQSWSQYIKNYDLTEHYIRIDRDEDGIAELLRVTTSGSTSQGGAGTLIEIEEVDRMPFATFSPTILTHKFFGLSVADLVLDVQRMKSALTRGLMDNAYLANNSRTIANEKTVNLDDLMTSRPGGIIRYTGEGGPSAHVMPVPNTPLPAETFQLLDYWDRVTRDRTGTGADVPALDKSALQNVSPTVAALQFDKSRAKTELVARIIAEVGFKPLFRGIHELLMKHQDKDMTIKLRGEWVDVNPGDWRTRENTTVQVGIGQVSRERRINALDKVLAMQEKLVSFGATGSLIMPKHIHKALSESAEADGLQPDLFYMDPATAQPKQPEPPSAQDELMKAQAQALVMDGQSKMQKNQIEAQKLQLDQQMQAADLQYKSQEAQTKRDLAALQGRMAQMKAQIEAGGKVASMQLEKEKAAVQASINAMSTRQEHMRDERDRDVDVYKIQLDNLTKLMTAHGLTQDPFEKQRVDDEKATLSQLEKENTGKVMADLTDKVITLQGKLAAAEEDQLKPREITYDDKGLILQIGNRKVKRDKSGKALSVG